MVAPPFERVIFSSFWLYCDPSHQECIHSTTPSQEACDTRSISYKLVWIQFFLLGYLTKTNEHSRPTIYLFLGVENKWIPAFSKVLAQNEA